LQEFNVGQLFKRPTVEILVGECPLLPFDSDSHPKFEKSRHFSHSRERGSIVLGFLSFLLETRGFGGQVVQVFEHTVRAENFTFLARICQNRGDVLAGVVVIREPNARFWKRVKREIMRGHNRGACSIHRGPDDEGFFWEGSVGFGARRLSIVDVAGRHQPISNEDWQVWIAFNGEIYNHPELRSQLIDRGHRYRTHCDTETVVHCYEEYGESCLEKLRGMFAFSIWDAGRRCVLLARDRLGIKPLYWCIQTHACESEPVIPL
jgi:glutamine phosphoribosylpyrophosphate amidotransferase